MSFRKEHPQYQGRFDYTKILSLQMGLTIPLNHLKK